MLPKAQPVGRRRVAPTVVLLGLALAAPARIATADDTSDCIAASEAAQTLRDQRALLEARDKLTLCARDVCPGPIRLDCIQQQVVVAAAMPSIVLRAKDASGADATEVQVTCDGKPFATRLDGNALLVNPGSHVFRFESPSLPPVERTIVVAEGEKNRLVVTDLTMSAPAVAQEPSSPAPPASRQKASGDDLFVPGVVLAGIGVAALTPMSVLWVTGTHDVHEMRTTCAPAAGGTGCPSDRIDADRTKLVLGDVFMGIAAAGIATGAVLIVISSYRPADERQASLRVEATPLSGGAFVSAAGHF
jgi:hypothetical protein